MGEPSLKNKVERLLPCAFDDGEIATGTIPFCSLIPHNGEGEPVATCTQLVCPFRYRARLVALIERECERVRRETIERCADMAIDIQPGVIGGTGRVNQGIKARILRLKEPKP